MTPVEVEGDPFKAPVEVQGDPFAPKAEPLDHSAMVDRIAAGQQQMGHLEAIGKAAKDAWGNEPLGLEPGSENTQFLINAGLLRDPQKATSSIRWWSDALVKSAPALIDAAGRAWNAGFTAAGAAAGEVARAAGVPPDRVQRIQDAGSEAGEVLGTYLMGEGGGAPHTEISRVVRDSSGRVVDDHLGSAPTPAVVDTAANVIGNAAGTLHDAPSLRDKVRALYQENGIHPAELAADAAKDPTLAQHLASDIPTLPARYTGFDPVADKNPGEPAKLPAGVTPALDEALKTRTVWPETPDPGAVTMRSQTQSQRWGDAISRGFDKAGIGSIVRDLQMKATPMADRGGTPEARAAAKDLANANRVARFDFERAHAALTDAFPKDRLEAMWHAADLDSVLEQSSGLGKAPDASKLKGLAPAEKFAVQRLFADSADAWEDAKRTPGVLKDSDARALPSYVPRMIVNQLMETGEKKPLGLSQVLNAWGRNLRTTTANLKRRKYLTAAETEAAAKESLGEGAEIVRDIRTLPLATARLRQAIAGRKLLNRIREMGELEDDKGEAGMPTVAEGFNPDSKSYFTIPEHPAFYMWKRDFEDPDGDGKRVPVFVRKDFEGPLRAILIKPEGETYKAVMNLKAKATSLIMYSPLLHNAVIFGRQFPATVFKMKEEGAKPGDINLNPAPYLNIYFTGNKVRNDPDVMRQAVADGLVPMVRDGAQMDIRSIATDPSLEPGRSTTAKLLAYIPGLFDKRAGTAVKTAIDKAGDFWHNTLLWDRIADLQAGLYKNMRDDMVKKGFDEQTAGRAAAHLANRYAGILPPEAMSVSARKISNVMMFSRSYTLGNIGAMKDMFVGLPRDVQAQIARDGGVQALADVRSYAQRKAIGIVAVDIALFYAGNSLLQSGFAALRANPDKDNKQEPGFVDRMLRTIQRAQGSPFEAVNPFFWLEGMTAQGGNEPGRTDRALIGYDSGGTAEYTRVPVGRTGGEMAGWMTHPAQMAMNKMSTLAKPLFEDAMNQDALGRYIYNPYANTPEEHVRNVGRMIWHFMEAQGPGDSISAAWELMNGNPTEDEKATDWKRVVGPVLGFMFSHGAPGGPAEGRYFEAQREDEYLRQQNLPKAKKLIEEGDIEGAKKFMDAAHMPLGLQKWTIEVTLDPSKRFQTQKFKAWFKTLPDAQQEQLEMEMSRGHDK